MITAIIVDDEAGTIEVLKSMLQKIDGQIVVVGTATNKQNAVEILSTTDPDVLFLDINMPMSSGLDLLDLYPNRKFKVIFITAYPSLESVAKKYEYFGFLPKPIDEDDLSKLMQKLKISLNKTN